jgi:DNA-binding NtrC family response regulator
MNGPVARVLIVDDEPLIRTIMHRALARAGHEVLEADCVAAAQEVLRVHVVDVVTTDLRMPGGNGTVLIAWVQHHLPALPILCVTAFADDITLSVPMLAKPFATPQLLAAIDALLAARPPLARASTGNE